MVQTPAGQFGGMMNLGPRPTFGDMEVSIEAHLFDVSRDFYGNRVRIDFVSFLRETRKFGSPDELVAQLGKDRENALISLTQLTRAVNLKGSTGTAHFTPSVA
jgi:riboflavin kinase/FMN adenylyltransferase